MKTKILSGLICCLGIYSATAQTITAPLGTPLTITNAVDITVPGGTINLPNDGSFNVGGAPFLKAKNAAENIFMGLSSGNSISSGTGNLLLGASTGFNTTTGSQNSFFGTNSGYSNTAGSFNTFLGSYSGYTNSTGIANLFLGYSAGYTNGVGNYNVFFGSNAGYANTSGSNNIFLGASAGNANTTGLRNVAIGVNSAPSNTTGTDNTYIGNASNGSAANTNSTAIGANANVTTSNTVVLGNNATVVIGASAASATPAKLEVTGTTAAKSGVKFTSLATGALTGAGNNLRTGGFLTVDNTGEIVWAATGASRLGNPDGITSAEGTATFSDNNWSLANGYLKNTSKRGVVIGEGITSMPEGYSFYVADGILTEKVKVAIKGTDEWADYVFGKNYNRMSLTDVAKYIEKNKHLPNVPSAAEMVQNGNDLHKTDVKLLEKIEELTLYMIEMKKENEQLKKDVDSLKKRRK